MNQKPKILLIGVATYSIETELPKELRSFLASAEEISERLNVFNEKGVR